MSTSHVSTVNSSTTPLPIGGTFTGVSETAAPWASATVSAFCDQAGEVRLEWSADGVVYSGLQDVQAVSGGAAVARLWAVKAQFGRLVFVNTSGAPQTALRVVTMWHVAREGV